MFKKKININYTNILQKKDAEEMFKTMPFNFPSYFKSIPKERFHLKYKKFLPFLKTIKTCPGFINLYKRSILVTSPYDIFIIFNENDIDFQRVGVMPDYKAAIIHENDQFLMYTNNKKYKFILKIQLPITLNSKVPLLLSESSYHLSDFKKLSGIIPSNYYNDLNFFIPIKKDINEIYIKKGDPLFLLTPLCVDKVKLKFNENKTNHRPELTFTGLKKYIMDKII